MYLKKAHAVPKLRLTYVPPMDANGKLEGYALNVDPEAYRVVVYIYVPNAKGWWTKTFFQSAVHIY